MGNVGVAVVKGYGVDGDEDGGWAEGWNGFGDDGVFRAGVGGEVPAVGKTSCREGFGHC